LFADVLQRFMSSQAACMTPESSSVTTTGFLCRCAAEFDVVTGR